jgi:hypothetical protein
MGFAILLQRIVIQQCDEGRSGQSLFWPGSTYVNENMECHRSPHVKHDGNEARSVMRNSPRYEFLRSIDHTFPSNNFKNIIDDYPRWHCSLLFQLRSGHVPLNKYLHRISKSPSPRCQQCNEREETVHHFLVSCPKYARQHATLRKEIGPRASQLQQLLSNCHNTKALFTYIASTKRFDQTFGDVTPPNPKETAGE